MADDHALQQIKMREKFAELRNAALAELERRGYDVRGKTPAQIRQMLKRRPSK
jgi:SOS response regulatory protein OraA/RecX